MAAVVTPVLARVLAAAAMLLELSTRPPPARRLPRQLMQEAPLPRVQRAMPVPRRLQHQQPPPLQRVVQMERGSVAIAGAP